VPYVSPKEKPRLATGLFLDGLDLAYLEGVRAFWALTDFKAHLVSFAKLVELYVLEFVHVEKEILFLSVDGDETEALVCKTGDCSFLHGCLYDLANADSQNVEF
jgi:hypothetical protein